MSTNESKILIVDDEEDILEFVRYNLKKEGYQVETALNGKVCIKKLDTYNPDLILMDIMMPEMDGVECCRYIRDREKYDHILIAFLTARNEDYSQIAALDYGGDDYITKPIRPKVLMSRIKALFRRGRGRTINSSNIIEVGNITIDKEKVSVLQNGQEVILAKKEFELLCLLVSKPGKVFSREEIFNKIWGADVIVGNRTIDVHIRKIREKLGDENIKTIKGMGYKFEF